MVAIDRSDLNAHDWGTAEARTRVIVDRFLEKGVGIDNWIRLSLAGLDDLLRESRVVTASEETFLRYAEAVGLVSEE